jgi:class 3 adenylate cyclase
MTGDLRQALETTELARSLFADEGQWGREAYAIAILAWLAHAEGDFARCEELVADGRERMRRAAWQQVTADLLLPLVMGRVAEGRIADALDAISLLSASDAALKPYLTAYVHAADRSSNVTLDECEPARTVTGLTMAALSVDVAWLDGSRGVAPGIRAVLDAAARHSVEIVPGLGSSVTRLRGIAALAEGSDGEGRRLLRRAITAARKSGALLEEAKSQLVLAESLAVESPVSAMNIAAKAARAFAEMGAIEFLARARRLSGQGIGRAAPGRPLPLQDPQLEILIDTGLGRSAQESAARLTLSQGAVERYRSQLEAMGVGDEQSALELLKELDLLPLEPRAPLITAPSGLRHGRFQVIMFTDVVDSTVTNVALGDELYAEMLTRHNAIIQAEVQRVGGRVIKGTGDGVMAAFDSCAAALDCATAFRERFPLTDPRAGSTTIAIRVGLHGGQPLEAGDDLIGVAVSLAFRVANQAGAGVIFASDPVRGLSVGLPYTFESRGRVPLKGFDERVRIFEVKRAARPV